MERDRGLSWGKALPLTVNLTQRPRTTEKTTCINSKMWILGFSDSRILGVVCATLFSIFTKSHQITTE